MKDQTIIEEIAVNAKIEKVWEAITIPEKMKKWYFEMHNFKLERGNVFYFYEPNGTNFKHVCKVIDVVPGKRIRHSWSYPEYSKGISILTWKLTAKENVTYIKLSHSGIENFSDAGSDLAYENFKAGWQEIVQKCLPEFLKDNR